MTPVETGGGRVSFPYAIPKYLGNRSIAYRRLYRRPRLLAHVMHVPLSFSLQACCCSCSCGRSPPFPSRIIHADRDAV